MKKLFSYLYFPIALAVTLLASLVNNIVNPADINYIRLLFILPMLALVIFTMLSFAKNKENTANQNLFLVILSPILFIAITFFCGNLLSFIPGNRVFMANFILSGGCAYIMCAFTLRIKRFLGSFSVFYNIIAIFSCVFIPIAAIIMCLAPTMA